MNYMPSPLLPYMTVTNEPGIYKEGRHGIRIENTQIILPYRETEFGTFLQFDPLTLCPIDMEPIDWSLLDTEEMAQPLPQPGVRPTGSVARPRAPHMASRGDLAIRTHKNNS